MKVLNILILFYKNIYRARSIAYKLSEDISVFQKWSMTRLEQNDCKIV